MTSLFPFHVRPGAATLSCVFLVTGAGMLAGGQASARAADSQAEPSAEERLGGDLAAYGRKTEVTFEELDQLIVWRHALTIEGRAALRQLLDMRMLARLGEEAKLEVTPAMLSRRWEELDRQIRSEGNPSGLRQVLADSDVDSKLFRDTLHLAIVQELLTRRALGIPADATVTSEQQTMWLEGVLERRGYTEEPHPWVNGVVARCGDVTIGTGEYARFLRDQLQREDIVDACYQLLALKRIRARMPDLSDEAIFRGVEAEIDRRRVAAERNPLYQGIAYDDLLEAKGLSLAALRLDPAIHVSALAILWVDRSRTDEDLRDAYEAERKLFDGRYGEGVEVRVLVLHAAKYKNELIKRDFEEAEKQLLELRARMRGIEDFERLARLHSEDATSRESGGLIGVVTRGAAGVPEALRRIVFAKLDTEQGDVAGTILGPVRLPSQGSTALVCLGARRPTPTWEAMSRFVRRELRARFLEEVLPKSSVRTWLDVE